MKQVRTSCAAALLVLAAGMFSHRNAQSKPAVAKPIFTQVIEAEIDTLERQLVGVAEAMPEDKFNFTPADLKIQNLCSRDEFSPATKTPKTSVASVASVALITKIVAARDELSPAAKTPKTSASFVPPCCAFGCGHAALC